MSLPSRTVRLPAACGRSAMTEEVEYELRSLDTWLICLDDARYEGAAGSEVVIC